MDKVIKWGILGCGKIATKFGEDLAFVDDCVITACASRNARSLSEFQEKFGIYETYRDYQEFAQNADVDVIYIASPHAMHYDHAMMCLNAGKSVLCEKPFAVNGFQAAKMIALAKEKQCFIMEAMWTAFLPAILSLKLDIQKGSIGIITSLKADFGFKTNFDLKSRLFDPNLAGGSLLDVGIYPVFMSLLLLGIPSGITADAVFSPEGIDLDCKMILHYEDGKKAILTSSLMKDMEIICGIEGTEGSIFIPSRFHESNQYILVDKYGKSTTKSFENIGRGYAHEIIHVRDCLKMNWKESPIMDFKITMDLITILDNIRDKIGLKYPFEP